MRWIVLLAAFTLWLGCMTLVYLRCRPAQIDDLDPTSRRSIDRAFAENAPDHRAWKIYVDPADLDFAKSALAGDKPAAAPRARRKREWNGVDESVLVLAGRIETKIKRKTISLDGDTTLTIALPEMALNGKYVGHAHVNRENGLDSCGMTLDMSISGVELSAKMSGNREENSNELIMNGTITQGQNTITLPTRRENIGSTAALNAELVPFQFNVDAKPSHRWIIVTFDMDALGESNGVKAVEVYCVGRATILMNGAKSETYEVAEVRKEDGPWRAWYSPNGEVLKQYFSLLGVLDVMFVREDSERVKTNSKNEPSESIE